MPQHILAHHHGEYLDIMEMSQNHTKPAGSKWMQQEDLKCDFGAV
jgi:hypothetical protein